MNLSELNQKLWITAGIVSGEPHPKDTERNAELPLAFEFLAQHPDAIEIGAVTPYYREAKHRVFDPYDKHPKCERFFAEDIDFKDKRVLSISTIEHIGNGEFNQPRSETAAWNILQKIAEAASSYLISWPAGWNVSLDARAEASDLTILKLVKRGHRWEKVESLKDVRYGYPLPYGLNGLYVLSGDNLPAL